MDVLDLKTGSLYGILAIASCIYLLRGFSLRLRPLMKAMLALDILVDLIFFPRQLDSPVYRFIKSLTSEDRIFSLSVLMACVLAMDAGAWLFAARLHRRRARLAITNSPASTLQRLSRPLETPKEKNGSADLALKVNEKRTRQVGLSFVLLAVFSRFSGLFFAGILGESSPLQAILTWQPEQSLGYSFLEMAGSMFFPVGLALLVMASKAKRHWIPLIAMMGFGFLSPWKSGNVSLIVVYGLAVYCLDPGELRRFVFKKSTAVVAFMLIVFLGVKTQFRNSGRAYLSPQPIMENIVGVLSGHSGGVYQTYTYVLGSLQHGHPYMNGHYNAQALYLWVPRLLWKEKPRVAGEELYYYLDLTKSKDEPYGSAFAITLFGGFYLDFGLWGSLVCSFLFGGLTHAGEKLLRRLRQSPSDMVLIGYVVFSTVWLNSAFALCEGGLPPALTGILFTCALGGSILVFWSSVKARREFVPLITSPAKAAW